MITFSPYFSFNGNCREAMTFYQGCFGGTLSFQSIADAPSSNDLPEKIKDCILQASLITENLVLLATDMVAEEYLIKGNALSILLNFKNEEEIKACYQKLSNGGHSSHPLELNFWGVLFGAVTDKYGNCWLLSFQEA